jgi:hypothetical protein
MPDSCYGNDQLKAFDYKQITKPELSTTRQKGINVADQPIQNAGEL